MLRREERRKIILDNFYKPSYQINFEELKKKSLILRTPILNFYSKNINCGDEINILATKEGDKIKSLVFSAENSCLIIVSALNILCSWTKDKEVYLIKEVIYNCKLMSRGEKFELTNCREMEAFSDISSFPNRIKCLELVLKSVLDSTNI